MPVARCKHVVLRNSFFEANVQLWPVLKSKCVEIFNLANPAGLEKRGFDSIDREPCQTDQEARCLIVLYRCFMINSP